LNFQKFNDLCSPQKEKFKVDEKVEKVLLDMMFVLVDDADFDYFFEG